MKKIYSSIAKLILKITVSHFNGSKKEVVKFCIQTLINILAAVVTALGATSCVC